LSAEHVTERGKRIAKLSYIYGGGSIEENDEAQKKTAAHGLRNSGKHAMIYADLMRFSKKFITSV